MGLDWKEALKKVAPALGSLIGGPIGGALKIVSNVLLGKPDGTSTEVASALAGATPDQLQALKDADQKFVLDLQNIGIEYEKLAIEDRANARAREIAMRDWTPRVLGFMVIGLFVADLTFMALHPVPPDNKEALLQMTEILKMAVVLVLGYYFGSSVGSKNKDGTLASAALK